MHSTARGAGVSPAFRRIPARREAPSPWILSSPTNRPRTRIKGDTTALLRSSYFRC
jgi:hypothetical protein